MATYNSAQNGDWNTDATWTEAGHPNANDDVTIITHDVTYDVGVSAITWGNCTINSPGVLIFPITASSKMLFNATGILTVNSGGELRAGTSGAPIGSGFLCQIHWPQGAATRNVLVLANGGTISIYGDPAYYGSAIEATLDSEWNAGGGLTLYVEGDYSAKWAAGQHFIIHDYAAYVNYQTDAEVFEIDSVGAYDAGNDRTPIVVTAAGDSDTFAVGAGLWILDRNVEFLDPGSPWAVYGYQAYVERIKFDNNQATGNSNLNIQDALFRGWYRACDNGYNLKGTNLVYLNCFHAIASSHGHDLTDTVFASNYIDMYYPYNGVSRGWSIGSFRCFDTTTAGVLIEMDLIGAQYCFNNFRYANLIGNIWSCDRGLENSDFMLIRGNIKKCKYGIFSSDNVTVYGDLADHSVAASSSCESLHIIGGITGSLLGIGTPFEINLIQGGVLSGNTNNFTAPAGSGALKRIIYEDCLVDAVTKELEIHANCGDFLCLHNGDGNWQVPDSGSAFILQATPNINCDGLSNLGQLGLTAPGKYLSFGYAETGAKTLTFKVYPVGWSASLTDAELFLEVFYLAAGAGGIRTRKVSGTLTMANGAWRDLTVSFTTGQDGVFYYNLILQTYEAGDYVLIDPEWSLS